jgi:hypothetical protein
MNKKVILVLFCLVALVLGDGLKRSLKVDVKDAEVSIDNKADNGDEKSHVKANIRLNHNDGMVVKYSAKAKDSTSSVDVDFTVSFDSIVEFTYKNGDAYNPATDVARKTITMGQVSWNKFTCNQDDTEWVCSSSTTGTTNKVGVEFKFSSESFSDGPFDVANTDMKITLTVDDFQYLQTDSSLALCFSGTSKEDFKQNTDGVKSKQRQMGSTDFFFTWLGTIQADGTDVDIADSPLQNSDSNGAKKFAFCVSVDAKVPKSLVYDPVIGISPASVLVPSLILLLTALLALM